jgi:hypothetical protein
MVSTVRNLQDIPGCDPGATLSFVGLLASVTIGFGQVVPWIIPWVAIGAAALLVSAEEREYGVCVESHGR